MDQKVAFIISSVLELVIVAAAVVLIYKCRKKCCKNSQANKHRKHYGQRGHKFTGFRSNRANTRVPSTDMAITDVTIGGPQLNFMPNVAHRTQIARHGNARIDNRLAHSLEELAGTRSSFSSRSVLSSSAVESERDRVIGPVMLGQNQPTRVWRNVAQRWGLPPAVRQSVWTIDAERSTSGLELYHRPNALTSSSQIRTPRSSAMWRGSEMLPGQLPFRFVHGIQDRLDLGRFPAWRSSPHIGEGEISSVGPSAAVVIPSPYNWIITPMTAINDQPIGLTRSDPQLTFRNPHLTLPEEAQTPPPPYSQEE